jgi:YD repeat-containing protein
MRFAVKFAITALLSLGLSTVVAAESNQESIPQPINVRTFQVILSHDEPENDEVGKLQYRGGLDLRARDPRFGGLSGLDISPDGRQLISVTDRGNWFTAQQNYNRDGRLVGMSDTIMMPIRAANGTPLTSRADRDAESIMRLSDGSLVVGFERHHRLHRFTASGRAAQPFDYPAALRRSPNNGGAEAVTRLGSTQLLILSERLETNPGIATGWIGAGKSWHSVGLRKTGIFHPVGAATRDDGSVFLLERRYTAIGGIAVRISRVPPDDISPGAIFQGIELGELAPPMVADNFEGIAVRRGKPGETLIYVVSDDNFHSLQRTLLLMFSLAE